MLRVARKTRMCATALEQCLPGYLIDYPLLKSSGKRQYGHQAPTPEQLREDGSVPWQEVTAFGAGKLHAFRVKVFAPVLWKKAGPDLPPPK